MPKQTLTFILNKNLDFPVTKEPWTSIFSAAGIQAEETTDLAKIDQLLTAGGPDLAYVAGAAFCVMLQQNNQHYRGLVIATSKFTGQAAQRTLLVVRHDDPATSLDDLEGSEYAYLNRSCSSSFFPPAILLQQKGKQIDTFFKLKQVAGWQARIDAVVARSVRATMILEDVWKMTPKNTDVAKVIGEYFPCVPAILIVRKDLDRGIVNTIQEYLLSYVPEWTNVYGAFRPFYFADVQTFYHQLGLLKDR
jgi:ABC-type phosphate/phosphonate transport system substrate-binding protein